MSKLVLMIWSIFSISCSNSANKASKDTTFNETQSTTKKEVILETQEAQTVDNRQIEEETIAENPIQHTENSTIKNDIESAIQETATTTEIAIETTPAENTETISTINSEEEEEEEEEIEETTEEMATEKMTDTEVTSITPVAKTDTWNDLLTKHVSNNGDVDYKGFLKDKAKLKNYLDYMATNSPQANWSKKQKLVYYINLYNAGTVNLILDNYPTKSIKDINKPWGKAIIKVGDKMYSLGDLEHKILRKMNEPRIHFAINCASYSCPKLINKAFTTANVEKMLEEATFDFINDPKRNIISADKLKLSNIFKWYKKDFTDNGSLIDYINPYLKNPVDKKTSISYLKYDWSLNETK